MPKSVFVNPTAKEYVMRKMIVVPHVCSVQNACHWSYLEPTGGEYQASSCKMYKRFYKCSVNQTLLNTHCANLPDATFVMGLFKW